MADNSNITITLGQFCDDLDALVRRCWALNAAFSGLMHDTCNSKDPMFGGVDQLINDICVEGDKLSGATQRLFGTELAMQELVEELKQRNEQQ